MVKLAPRQRPRKKSLAWSRLGWLIELEAAYLICRHQSYSLLHIHRSDVPDVLGRCWMYELRRSARIILGRQEVIL